MYVIMYQLDFFSSFMLCHLFQAEITEEKYVEAANNIKNDDDLETDNLEELIEAKSKLLKKLGELVPDEIKYLVGSPKSGSQSGSGGRSPVKAPHTPPGSPPPAKNHTALDMDVDDLIAQIEKEQPIDQPTISSDASETMEYPSNKSADETSQPKPEVLPFKPLFPSVQNIEEVPVISTMQDYVKPDENHIHLIEEDSVAQELVHSNVNIENKLTPIEPVPEMKVFNKYEPTEGGIENSTFKRKRRIAFDVLPAKRLASNNEDANSAGPSGPPLKQDLSYTTKYAQNFETCGERMGLGFQPDLNERDFNAPSTKKNSYSNFKKGNIMFHKGETMVPPVKEIEVEKEVVMSELEEKKTLIEAKLNFLTQSLPPVPPLQQLYIELQVRIT